MSQNNNNNVVNDWAKETENYLLSQNNQPKMPQQPVNSRQQTNLYGTTKQNFEAKKEEISIENMEKKASELSNIDLVNMIIFNSKNDSNLYVLNDMAKILFHAHQDKMSKLKGDNKQYSDNRQYSDNKPPRENRSRREHNVSWENKPKNFNRPKQNNYDKNPNGNFNNSNGNFNSSNGNFNSSNGNFNNPNGNFNNSVRSRDQNYGNKNKQNNHNDKFQNNISRPIQSYVRETSRPIDPTYINNLDTKPQIINNILPEVSNVITDNKPQIINNILPEVSNVITDNKPQITNNSGLYKPNINRNKQYTDYPKDNEEEKDNKQIDVKPAIYKPRINRDIQHTDYPGDDEEDETS